MANDDIQVGPMEIDVDGLRAKVTNQGNHVRSLKKEGKSQEMVTEAVNLLKQLKLDLAEAEKTLAKVDDGKPTLNRVALDTMLKRRMYIVPSFEIYGGLAGFFDFGPPACSVKANLIDVWKQHFVLEEDMLEVECPSLTMDKVLQASGHVERFTDLMVKDEKTGECFRADKLLEEHIDRLLGSSPTMTEAERNELQKIQLQADAFSPEELGGLLVKFGIKSPTTGGVLSSPFPFNLMFGTAIGAEGNNYGYLRPETAQGIFVNFRRLLDFNNGRLPFAAAQVGTGFRNEISPRSGLLRVREFTMAEIEHFVHPNEKNHEKFNKVAKQKLTLFPAHNQLTDGKTQLMEVGEAVQKGIINNETLGYFLARTHLFCQKIGIDMEKVRFRQHLPTEMAHYASDCWDLEIQLSYGWTECAGHADRACFDLKVHAESSGKEMTAARKYDQPKKVDCAVMKMNRSLLGKAMRKDNKAVVRELEELAEDMGRAMEFESKLAAEGKASLEVSCLGQSFEITREMVSFEKGVKTLHEERFLPSVIEPSFGIGRLLYAVLEHSFYTREDDEERGVMRFSPAVAAFKCLVLPLSSNKEFAPFVDDLLSSLKHNGVSCKNDSSNASIGRRYARGDELGIPFAITVDFETATERSVTLRERDSTSQVRVPLAKVAEVVRDLAAERLSWKAVAAKYPAVAAVAGDEKEKEPASASQKPSLVVEETGRGRFSRPAQAILP